MPKPKDLGSSSKFAVRLSGQQKALILVPAILVFLGTALVVWRLTQDIKDPPTEWAAIGAALTGGAAVVAVVGLPFAIWQLMIVQKEQVRIAEQLAKTVDIELGLLPSGADEVRDMLRLGAPPKGPNDSRNQPITIRARNTGELTAQNPKLFATIPTG